MDMATPYRPVVLWHWPRNSAVWVKFGQDQLLKMAVALYR